MPDAHFPTDEIFNVVECRRCGLAYVNPRPSFEEIGRFYPESFFSEFETNKRKHQQRYAVEAAYIDADLNGRGRLLLDVGCANGDFPRFMKRLGWEVEGVEIAAKSHPINDFQVYNTIFSEFPSLGPRYDVITAWAVLEHVHDPLAYFRKAGELLKPGGRFVFLVTNFLSLSSRRLFREDIPRHLYFFSEQTIKAYLGLSGMDLIRADHDNAVYQMRPLNWLRYYVRRLLGDQFHWQDIPPNRAEFIQQRGLAPGIISSVRYVISHPLTVIDRMLMPLFERYQLMTGRYGISIYVARKAL
jgi:SAM-dependent methyltransferase